MELSRRIVFDLFAGAGGFGLGFKMAGFCVKASLEKDNWAVETLRENSSKNEIIIHADIRSIAGSQIFESVDNIKPDIVIGGPPCQGFSVAGPTKDPADPRNSLFQDFARWVEALSPKIFVMENVNGLLNRKNIDGVRVLDIIVKTFEKLDYHVEVWRLNAAMYGVPQSRERIFIVGNRFGVPIGIPKPTHSMRALDIELIGLNPAITVGEAIGDLPVIEAGEGADVMDYETAPNCSYQYWARKASKQVYNHVAMIHTTRIIERYKQIQEGNSIKDLPIHLKVKRRSGNGEISDREYNSNYRHLKSGMVSYTIPASFYSTFIHPIFPRNLTSREAARIQSFPDTYIFKGKRTVISSKLLQRKGRHEENFLSQYNQIGNAVPPLLAESIAKHLKEFLNDFEQPASIEVGSLDVAAKFLK